MVTEQVLEPRWQHADSHQWHHWNELADSLVKWAAAGHDCPLPEAWCGALKVTPGLRWEWLRAAPAQVELTTCLWMGAGPSR